MKALYIRRFQPFHNGHLKILQKLIKKYDEIIIGIGSSQYSNTLENPFTSEERKLMIIKSLEEININNYRIVEIPDIHNYPKWVSHVVSIITDFDVVISNNPLTKCLFSKRGYIVKETQLYNRNECSGEEIRKKIINNGNWKDALPKAVYKIIVSIDGAARLKKLSN